MTDHLEGTLTGAHGRKLYWQGWTPAADHVQAVVVLVHGLHEHGGRYEWVAQQLTEHGYATYAVDHVGHGKSDGVRGQIGRMSDVVNGVDAMVTEVSTRHPDVPRFLVGHSMGALVALQYVISNPQELRGLVVSAAPVIIDAGSSAERAAAKVLTRVAPNLGVVVLDSAAVSRDPDVVAYHETNPLMVHSKVRARTATEMLTTADQVQAQLGRIRLPLLVMTGTADKLADPAGSQLIIDRVSSSDKTLKTYEGFYHEILNEPEKQVVLADLVEWIKERS